jgi:hypothetical protein
MVRVLEHSNTSVAMYKPLEHVRNACTVYQTEFPAIRANQALVTKRGCSETKFKKSVSTLGKLIQKCLLMDRSKATRAEYVRHGVAIVTNPELSKMLCELAKVPAFCDAWTNYALRVLTTSYDLTVGTFFSLVHLTLLKKTCRY